LSCVTFRAPMMAADTFACDMAHATASVAGLTSSFWANSVKRSAVAKWVSRL
jgi:hypothetical protein